MICNQPMDQIHLLSQKNASNSNNTMAKWKALERTKVILPIFSVKGHVVEPQLQEWPGPPSTMKTAPLLRRKVSKYTSKCDQGNITVVVCVKRISLCNRDRRFSGELAKQGSVDASRQTL